MKLEKFLNELSNISNIDIWITVEYICDKCGEKKYESWHWGHDDSIFYWSVPWSEEHFDVNLETHEVDPWNPQEYETWEITVPCEYGTCEDCSSNVPCEDFKNFYDEEWNTSVFHHGVTAFNKEEDGLQRIIDLSNCADLQICTSTEMIGDYGISVSGTTLVASSEDLWSTINKDTGKRYFNAEEHSIVYDINDLYDISGDHNEIVITNYSIEAIWCKEFVNDETKEILKSLAECLGVFYLETSKRR